MKHAVLRSIAHNIADSLASGIGLLIGVYVLDVFGEARNAPTGSVTVDFLAGTVAGTSPSASLAKAVDLYRQALPRLCAKHGVAASAFRTLSVSYEARPLGNRYSVTIEDRSGRCSTTDYDGTPGRRTKARDALGRLRPKAVRATLRPR